MGLYDTAVADLACPRCGGVAEREVQFKHRMALLERYRVGDYVDGLTWGRIAIEGWAGCPCPPAGELDEHGRTQHGSFACWVQADRGFLTAVTVDRPDELAERQGWMVERAGWLALQRLRALQAIRNTCLARLRRLERGDDDEVHPLLALHEEDNEVDLLWRVLHATHAELERPDERFRELDV